MKIDDRCDGNAAAKEALAKSAHKREELSLCSIQKIVNDRQPFGWCSRVVEDAGAFGQRLLKQLACRDRLFLLVE